MENRIVNVSGHIILLTSSAGKNNKYAVSYWIDRYSNEPKVMEFKTKKEARAFFNQKKEGFVAYLI